MTQSLSWYLRRARTMSPAELGVRVGDQLRQRRWARLQVVPGRYVDPPRDVLPLRRFGSPLPEGTRDRVDPAAREHTIAAADALLHGTWTLLGIPRADIANPDWFHDPVTGRRAPQDELAFGIDHRDPDVAGDVKVVWELSRHHHLTVLAAAYWLTGEERFALAVDRQLRSWWSANPFLSGIHWTSGIELGIRLISWVWIRRLLGDWPGAPELFEHNDEALAQIWWHQLYLDRFRSTGSSANNHLVAEAAGRVAAACAFPWYAESDSWRADAIRQLQRGVAANTFPSGVNRELASDYHRFVTELVAVAAAEADAAGSPLTSGTHRLLTASLDAAAALLDAHGRPPRQGDGDEGRALVLDDPEADPWAVLLDLGAQTSGGLPWWPAGRPSVLGTAVGSLTSTRPSSSAIPEGRPDGRPEARPDTFADAGIALLRTRPDAETGDPEIWCRCDGGPLGLAPMAAHGHADALSVEVRYDGIDILADPGTFCYHGDPQWRGYFRSTLAHNTVEVDGTSQAAQGGPFLWTGAVPTRVNSTEVGCRSIDVWSAHHTGYARLDRSLWHQRTVVLERDSRRLTVIDRLAARRHHRLRLLFHLGPTVSATLSREGGAELAWTGRDGRDTGARLLLPRQLLWTTYRGSEQPILGWYSPRFGVRVPTITLVGSGLLHTYVELRTELTFATAALEGDGTVVEEGQERADRGEHVPATEPSRRVVERGATHERARGARRARAQ